jgi:hypothetical protein
VTLKLNETSRNLVVRPITLLAHYPLRWNILTIFGEELEGVILETTNHSSEMAGDANEPAQPGILESQAEGVASFPSSLLPKCDTTMNTRKRRCK